MAAEILTFLFGQHVGLNADWIYRTWVIGPNLYIFENEDTNEYEWVRRTINDETITDTLLGVFLSQTT